MIRYLLFSFLLISPYTITAQCRVADMISGSKTAFDKPYEYDGFSYFKMQFGQKTQTIRKEFLALKGKKYELLFCTSGFEEIIRIQLYDEQGNLLAGTSIGNEKSITSFFTVKSGNYSIVYYIPASETGVEHEGCIAMLIGLSER